MNLFKVHNLKSLEIITFGILIREINFKRNHKHIANHPRSQTKTFLRVKKRRFNRHKRVMHQAQTPGRLLHDLMIKNSLRSLNWLLARLKEC